LENREPFWKKIEDLQEEFAEDLYPHVTIVVPTFNSAQKIGITIESLIHQEYLHYEILVIDANSTDRTLEIVKNFRNERIRLCTVTGYNRYEMINKGISLAKPGYLNVLFPGDYYIHPYTLRAIMGLGIKNNGPPLLFCGCLLRDAQEVKILFRPLTLALLKRGQQPTSLQSCWFTLSTFKEIGKFNTGLIMRGGYELLCRFLLNGKLSHASTNRVLTDYDLRGVARAMVIRHFWETGKVIIHYFGWGTYFRWLFKQTDVLRYFRLWWRSFKVAIQGRT
jgi:glycosyltransferase involved in cell wall biosynthesis